MSTYNFHGSVSGPSNFGDNGRIEVHHHGASPAETLRLATELVGALRREGAAPALTAEAETVRGELARAQQEQVHADRGRLRRALDTVTAGLTAGSGALVLAQELVRALG